MKQKHLKAAACAALAASMLLPCAQPARAAESTEVPVTISYAASQAVRAPSVLIPKEIRMKDETSCSYSVWAYCETAELDSLFDHVTVEPDSSFVLTNERTGDTFTASVSQRDTQFLADDVKNGEAYDMDGVDVMRKGTEGTISVDGIPEGRWTGAMTFYVNEVAHDHRWVVPVLSEDGIYLQGYACPCGETSHVHVWDEGIMEGTWVKARRCSCGEVIQAEDYDILRNTEESMQVDVMNAWIAKNITPDMPDIEKARKAMAEMNSWAYAYENKGLSCLAKTATCLGGNTAFAEYCSAMGIRAEVFSAGQYVGGDHFLTYVYINGEKLIADATPSGGIMGAGSLWTEDGLWLYCDLLDGIITDEEFEQWITAEER